MIHLFSIGPNAASPNGMTLPASFSQASFSLFASLLFAELWAAARAFFAGRNGAGIDDPGVARYRWRGIGVEPEQLGEFAPLDPRSYYVQRRAEQNQSGRAHALRFLCCAGW